MDEVVVEDGGDGVGINTRGLSTQHAALTFKLLYSLYTVGH